MGTPGYSINDLIQNAGQVKRVYDAFFHEYKSADAQLGDLAHDVQQFQKKLAQYQQNLRDRELQDPGSKSAKKTLDQCLKLLDDYKSARKVKDGRRMSLSFKGTFKTALFATEEEELKRLRDKLNTHKLDMVLDQVSIDLRHRHRQAPSTSIPIPSSTSTSTTIVERDPTSPPATPSLLDESPLLAQGYFSPISPRLDHRHRRSPSFSLPDPAGPSRQPSRVVPAPSPRNSIPTSPYTTASPPHLAQQNSRGDSTTIPEFNLPDPALLYGQAEVHFGAKKHDFVTFKRKPSGTEYERGRQMEIKDQAGNSIFRHRIRLPAEDPCYPYTWHSNFQKGSTFKVNFKEAPVKSHKISRNGGEQMHVSLIPIYWFNDIRDYEDFQAQVRGKLLEGRFDVGTVRSAASSKKLPDATDQHLKIWKDCLTKECSLSYYASNSEKPQHLEFPLKMFQSETIVTEKGDLRLNFTTATPPKKRAFSKAFSKSPTESSVASTATASPEIFSRANTGLASGASSFTTAPPSRRSVASFQSDNSGQTTGPDSKESALESQAKKMKYLDFEFTEPAHNGAEATRFKNMYERLRKESNSRDLEYLVQNWQGNATPGWPESLVSASPRGTPYDRSPELRAHSYDAR